MEAVKEKYLAHNGATWRVIKETALSYEICYQNKFIRIKKFAIGKNKYWQLVERERKRTNAN